MGLTVNWAAFAVVHGARGKMEKALQGLGFAYGTHLAQTNYTHIHTPH